MKRVVRGSEFLLVFIDTLVFFPFSRSGLMDWRCGLNMYSISISDIYGYRSITITLSDFYVSPKAMQCNAETLNF